MEAIGSRPAAIQPGTSTQRPSQVNISPVETKTPGTRRLRGEPRCDWRFPVLIFPTLIASTNSGGDNLMFAVARRPPSVASPGQTYQDHFCITRIVLT
jgi:hypothetical protein